MNPFYESDYGKLYNCDCRELLFRMEPESVDMVLTSPPYDNLREYQGFEFPFEWIAQDLVKILKPGGVIVWVVNDQTVNGSETGTSFKQALFFMKLGLNLHDTMIYGKNNNIPLNHNRYDPVFEYMFVFSKGKPKTFNPIKVKCSYYGYKQKHTKRNSASTREKKGALRPGKRERKVNQCKLKKNIWFYDIGKNKSSMDNIWEHPATFPEKLAEDHILSWSNIGDLIFDPFMGSGTTAKMAEEHKRKWIGSEVSEEYCKITSERMDCHFKQMRLFDES